MSIHSCQALACETPHYVNDRHSDDCLCELCHEHDWRVWAVYPLCDGCEAAMLAYWAEEIQEVA